MSTIDRLDFKLVVDDTDFNKSITDAINRAKDMNKQVSQYLSSFSKMNGVVLPDFSQMKQHASDLAAIMKQVRQSIQEIKGDLKMATTAMRELRDAAKGADTATKNLKKSISEALTKAKPLQTAMKAVSKSVNSADQKMQSFAANAANAAAQMNTMGFGFSKQQRAVSGLNSSLAKYFSIWMGARFVKNMAEITGEFEKQRVSLQSILQDVQGADKIFNQIKQFSVKSPFQFSELTDYVKQLSAFSIPMEELFDTTKMLADVSAGLGVDMNRIVLAYGQIRSAAFLRGLSFSGSSAILA